MKVLKAALIQMPVVMDKEANLTAAADQVKNAADKGAEIAVLPEMFCCLYDNSEFVRGREPLGGRIWHALSAMASDNRIYLVGGSMPEEDCGKLYNTCFIFGPDGRQIARHRKMHLFDIDIKGGQSFFESRVFAPGDDITVFDTDMGRIGVCICFDIRFPELIRLMALEGAEAVIVPAAFNMTTGPAHWELTFRARALDNQIFMLGCAPARDADGPYVSYGSSIITGPWGDVRGKLGPEPGMLLAEADLSETESIRQQLPLMRNRRTDIYNLSLCSYQGRVQ